MNLKILVLWLMIFMHIIGDWILQTDKMADLKQKKTWEKFGALYKYDYMVVLILHSICWSFCIIAPLLIIQRNTILLSVWIIINTYMHSVIDNEKANKFSINLLADQLLHLIQIITTWFIVCCLC
jgi:hypothetical protein